MDVAGLLLTGGASRRMGRPKADLPIAGSTLAAVLAGHLRSVARGPVLEVGGTASNLPAVPDDDPGSGPLAAIATGVAALARAGWVGAALVVATDLPRLDRDLLAALADHPAPASVVPLDADGRPQLLCARYDAGRLAASAGLVAGGARAVRTLLDGAAVTLVPAEDLVVGGAGQLVDVDTPEDLARITGGSA